MIAERKSIFGLFFSIMMVTFSMNVSGGINNSFYRKIADKVWNTPDTLFNARVEIPDSLLENTSAVVIAWSDSYDIQRAINSTQFHSTMVDGNLANWLIKKRVERKMIKLLDSQSIGENSEYEFGRNKDIYNKDSKNNQRIVYDLKTAFGARILKPDGRIEEVDLTEAFEIGKGKSGNEDRHYKIAIPGLEPGDVLDYFYYEDERVDSENLDAENIVLFSEYPVLNRRITLVTNPLMTVEIKGYNGVPEFTHGKTNKVYQTASLTLHDIPGVNFGRYTIPYRQLPFVRIHLSNNTDRTIVRNTRRGGLHENVPIETIIAEIADYLKLVDHGHPDLVNNTVKHIKNVYLSDRPDASDKEVADAAWLTLNYYKKVDLSDPKKSANTFERALAFYDILTSLKVYRPDSIGIGIINPRLDVPTHDLAAWYETSFVVKTPDALYFMPLHNAIVPGELPGEFKGETAFIFPGNRRKLSKKTLIQSFTVPGKKVTENMVVFRDTVAVIADNTLQVSSTATFSGGVKAILQDVIDTVEWARNVEDFLNIPGNQRFRALKYDPIGRKKEIRNSYASHLRNFNGQAPDSITDVNVLSRGIIPDQPDMKIYAVSKYLGLVERLGDDISISIGRLTGMPKPLTDSERKRLLDVMLPFISQETHIILVKAPEGYKFDEASVNSLARNVSETVGQFLADPKITDDGDLLLSTAVKYKFADVPLSHWPSFMNLIDQAAAFGDATVILVKK